VPTHHGFRIRLEKNKRKIIDTISFDSIRFIRRSKQSTLKYHPILNVMVDKYLRLWMLNHCIIFSLSFAFAFSIILFMSLNDSIAFEVARA